MLKFGPKIFDRMIHRVLLQIDVRKVSSVQGVDDMMIILVKGHGNCFKATGRMACLSWLKEACLVVENAGRIHEGCSVPLEVMEFFGD